MCPKCVDVVRSFKPPHFHMRRTNTWHFLQQSGQFLRLSGRPPLRYGLGPTASKIVHFVQGNATCWSDACENAGGSPAPTRSLRSHRPPLEASRAPPWPLVGAFGASRLLIAASSLLLAWPNGMHGAIEYGQPLRLSRVGSPKQESYPILLPKAYLLPRTK